MTYLVYIAGALATVVVALVSGFSAYLLGRRRASGHVETSEAADLWRASEEIRQELRDEVVTLRKRVEELQAENRDLRAELDSMKEELGRCTQLLNRYERRRRPSSGG